MEPTHEQAAQFAFLQRQNELAAAIVMYHNLSSPQALYILACAAEENSNSKLANYVAFRVYYCESVSEHVQILAKVYGVSQAARQLLDVITQDGRQIAQILARTRAMLPLSAGYKASLALFRQNDLLKLRGPMTGIQIMRTSAMQQIKALLIRSVLLDFEVFANHIVSKASLDARWISDAVFACAVRCGFAVSLEKNHFIAKRWSAIGSADIFLRSTSLRTVLQIAKTWEALPAHADDLSGDQKMLLAWAFYWTFGSPQQRSQHAIVNELIAIGLKFPSRTDDAQDQNACEVLKKLM